MRPLQLFGCFVLSATALLAAFVLTAAEGEAADTNAAKVGPATKSHAHAEGWSGIITYQKTLYDSHSSDEPVIGAIDQARNHITHQLERVYRYDAQIVVIDGNSKTPQTDANITLLDSDSDNSRQVEWGSCGWGPEHNFVIAGEHSKITRGHATAPAKYFNIGIDEKGGSYHFSLELPELKGAYNQEDHVKRSGFCQPGNNLPIDVSDASEVRIEPQAVSIDDGKLDPKHPDRLHGSKTWDTSSPQVKSFAYTITWDLRRGPDNVMITDLHYEHPRYPDWNDWEIITPETGTIDGNPVKIKATVVNLSSEHKDAVLKLIETFKGDHWNAARKDEPLENGTFNVPLDPGEERTVELQFDSTGYAWMDDAPHQPLADTPQVRPFSVHRIRAELSVNEVKKDEKTENLKIAPRPVVLLHGLWSDAQEWAPYQNYLTLAWGYEWRAYPVGEYPSHGEMRMGTLLTEDAGQTIAQNVAGVTSYVEYARHDRNAWHVDMVAHSTGGLVARR
ncbi:MAG TPA: alpha/beta hydrolase [Opitutaceae bacterium]|nr:alpha/beta hydrolase [Opitutaceae bacterium]